ENPLQLAQRRLAPGRVVACEVCSLLLEFPATPRAVSGLHGDPVRDTVQPAAHRLPFANQRRLPRQDDEHGLVSVLRVMLLLQNPSAETPDRAAVPLDQSCKCGLVTRSDKAIQQLLVAEVGSE